MSRTLTTLAVVLMLVPVARSGQNSRQAAYPPSAPLWGTTTDGRPAVLWTDGRAMFNSNPADPLYARSHWDDIGWEGGWLTYHGTYSVAPLAPSSVTFYPGIRYMPATGNGTWHGWSFFIAQNGSGVVTYRSTYADDGWAIAERMYWFTGENEGWTTVWDEQYELGWINGQRALVHAWGGNATGADRWDITFSSNSASRASISMNASIASFWAATRSRSSFSKSLASDASPEYIFTLRMSPSVYVGHNRPPSSRSHHPHNSSRHE